MFDWALSIKPNKGLLNLHSTCIVDVVHTVFVSMHIRQREMSEEQLKDNWHYTKITEGTAAAKIRLLFHFHMS